MSFVTLSLAFLAQVPKSDLASRGLNLSSVPKQMWVDGRGLCFNAADHASKIQSALVQAVESRHT